MGHQCLYLEILNPVQAHRDNPAFKLTVSQLGLSKTVKAPILIDGRLLSPLPSIHLRHPIRPRVNAPVGEKIAQQELIARRGFFTLVAHVKALKDGAQDFVCRTHAARIVYPVGDSQTRCCRLRTTPRNGWRNVRCTPRNTPASTSPTYGSTNKNSSGHLNRASQSSIQPR